MWSKPLSKLLLICILSCTLANAQTRSLKVGLFKYLPFLGDDDLKEAALTLEKQFESQFPEVDLDLTWSAVDTYNMSQVVSVLSDPAGYNILELDLLTLGYVQSLQLIQPLSLSQQYLSRYVPSVLPAAMINGTFFAAPSWTCSNYIASGFAQISNHSGGNADLLQFFKNYGGNHEVDFMQDFQGKWTLPSLYIDAYVDTYGPASINDSMTAPIDQRVVQYLVEALAMCTNKTDGSNKCRGVFHEDEDDFYVDYIEGDAVAAGSYSEILSEYFWRNLSTPQTLISAPFGEFNHPVMFVDGLVVSSQCNDTCLEDATNWINFYTDLNVLSYISLGFDSPHRKSSRYVGPSLSKFYQLPEVKSDPIYERIYETIQVAVPFPNEGFLEVQHSMYNTLCEALQNCE
eukprot:TRINITY_DN515_c0_g1_i2.p1 TRINITY_DN515_c0_g1~~TRINITY_DN515_c0_g1_i2.p1  ORF type:complete len:402 (+),score=78.73 TRINITY_DN515_c0_g1_i2:649-1854(+)